MCNHCQRVSWLKHTHAENPMSLKSEKRSLSRSVKLTPTHHITMFVHLVRNMHTRWVLPPKIFHIQAISLLPLYYHPTFYSAGQHLGHHLHLHSVFRDVPLLHMHSLWLNSAAFTYNVVTTDTQSQMWHLMVTRYPTNSCIHTTLLHRESFCVLSSTTQMVATWCELMGSCDGFEQDMYTHTHTDGDPLRMVRRWTCWLLICSDQWFPTWSSDNGEAIPTGLAQWFGTLGKQSRATSQVSFNPNSLLIKSKKKTPDSNKEKTQIMAFWF